MSEGAWDAALTGMKAPVVMTDAVSFVFAALYSALGPYFWPIRLCVPCVAAVTGSQQPGTGHPLHAPAKLLAACAAHKLTLRLVGAELCRVQVPYHVAVESRNLLKHPLDRDCCYCVGLD